MKCLDVGRSTLSLGGIALILAACGMQVPLTTSPASPAQIAVGATRDAHSSPLLYVTNGGDYHDVTVYRAHAKNPEPIETISRGLLFPLDVCLDGRGTLYVVDGDGWVAEYPAGKMKPSKIITKGINTPSFCAIDANSNLWVTNLGGSNVTEYLPGSTKPHTVITEGLHTPDGVTIDHAGNMYVSNGSYGPYNVVVFPPGSKSPSRTITDGVTGPVGLGIDANGTLYVANEPQSNVEEYPPGQSHPYREITEGLDHPVAVTVSQSGYIYVTNEQFGSFEIVEFAPGSITPLDKQITKGLYYPFGTAYSPPLLP